MAASLRMEVIAEGVESEAQYLYLRDHGCHLMQGYWFSRAGGRVRGVGRA